MVQLWEVELLNLGFDRFLEESLQTISYQIELDWGYPISYQIELEPNGRLEVLTYLNHEEALALGPSQELLHHQVGDHSWPVSRPDDDIGGQTPLELLQGLGTEGRTQVR